MTTSACFFDVSVVLAATPLATHVAASHAAASPLLWYLTRALAVGAYVSLTISVLFGALRSIARQLHERLSWMVDELHQFLALLAATLTLGHLLTLLLDPYLPFSLQNLLVPLSEPYRPFAVVLGVLALYTMVALLLTSWFRVFMPYTFWRALHYLSFVTFILVTAHGLLAGSDANELWMRAIYGGAVGAFAFVALVRLVGRSRTAARVNKAPSVSKSSLGQR
ncbi:MAG TPA: ferric reductase-like transmembrane domain-containing protein [Ktedonobacterales bacterium]